MKAERYHSLDALRAVLMIWGVVVHTGTLGQCKLLDYASLFSGFVRMEAFFIISGFLSLMLVRRYGGRTTILKRLVSIGVPLTAALVLLNPLTNYLVYSYHNGTTSIAAYADSLQQVALPNAPAPVGPMVWHLHVWFLVTLLIYGLVTPVASSWVNRITRHQWFRYLASKSQQAQFALVCVALTFSCLTMRVLFELTLDNALRHTPVHFILRSTLVYFPFFFIGMVMYAKQELLSSFRRMRLGHLGASAGLVLASWIGFAEMPKFIAEAVKFSTEVYFATTLASSLFVLFEKLVPHHNRVAKYLSDASYSVYLFHYLTIYVLAWGLRPVLGDHPAFFAAVIFGTVSGTLLVHHFLVQRVRLLRLLFNGKVANWHPLRLDSQNSQTD